MYKWCLKDGSAIINSICTKYVTKLNKDYESINQSLALSRNMGPNMSMQKGLFVSGKSDQTCITDCFHREM